MKHDSPEQKFYLNQHKVEMASRGEMLNFNTDIKIIYNDLFSHGKRYHIIEEVLDKAIAREYNLLVEVGAAQCSTLKYFNESYNFKKIIGYDIAFSDEILEKNTYKNIELLGGNFNHDFPLEDNSVDCLVMMMIIEHLFDPFHSFSEVRRILAKDGLAFINLPLVTSIKNRSRLLFGKLPDTSSSYETWFVNKDWDGNHLHYFSIDSIKRLCAEYDLEIIKMTPVGKFIFLKKLFPSFLTNEISFCVRKIIK
tara:strand:- start:409 stop:1164 length:756 start_codon:yes stop_codon:yes gene_type:complete